MQSAISRMDFMTGVREGTRKHKDQAEIVIYYHKDYGDISHTTTEGLYSACMMVPTFDEVMSKLFFYIDDKGNYALDYNDDTCQYCVSISRLMIEDTRWNVVDRALEILYRAVVDFYLKRGESVD